jgi:Gram-negative bacterial TonB protein C-terminal
MDVPRSQTLEVHLPSGYKTPFFSLPGERVLETPTVTMRIQRSVHMPPAHSWPFNHNKKVVVGELISRVDPQPSQVGANSATSATSVRVKAIVSKDGRIENVTQILGPPSLVPAVAKALHEWRYQPTLVDDKPVETQCFVILQFHAQSYHTAKRSPL